MHALVMTEPSTGPEHTEVRTVPEPRAGAGQVTVDVAYAGVNFLDVMARRGDPGYAPSWPYAPGLEISGTVRELGSGVTGLREGQRVAAFTTGGGLADIALADAALTVALPEGVPLPVAAAAPLMLSTALLLLTDVARLQPGDSVLMHSASGGVGSAVAQLVSVLGGGLRIGTVGRPDKVADARRAGWDVALVRDDDVAGSVRAAAPDGVDVILDPSGTGLLDLDLDIAAVRARVVLFGNASGGRPAPLPPLGRLIGGNVTLAGFSISRLTATSPQRAADALRRVLELVAEGAVDVSVTEIGSLGDVAVVHQLLAEGRGSGKYVVALSGG
jgi:NADPH2:quinone reductase